jgi:hypothetical protein
MRSGAIPKEDKDEDPFKLSMANAPSYVRFPV